MCEACGKRVWGAGVAGGSVFEAWEDKMVIEDKKRKEKRARKDEEERPSRGKGKSLDTRPSSMLVEGEVIQGDQSAADDGADSQSNVPAPQEDAAKAEPPIGPLVVLACRHIYHQSCLDALQEKQGGPPREREYRCPIDG
jgi:hypothetical protein